MRGWRLVVAVGATGVLLWLMRTPATSPPIAPAPDAGPLPVSLATTFDPSECGTITGRVEWLGPAPAVEPIPLPKPGDWGGAEAFPNPNAPEVQAGGLADAVIWLRNVDLARSRPWDHPAVTVETMLPHLIVRQGDRAGTTGVVRRGADVELLSREAKMHSVRGRGAAFFTQMLPDPNLPVRRRFAEPGMVELSSGSGYYWMRAYLLVSDHPYAAVSGPDGKFRLNQVPAGEYELVCWKPSWQVERYERDPELIVPVRLRFKDPVVREKPARVEAGRPVAITFSLSQADFGPAPTPPPP